MCVHVWARPINTLVASEFPGEKGHYRTQTAQISPVHSHFKQRCESVQVLFWFSPYSSPPHLFLSSLTVFMLLSFAESQHSLSLCAKVRLPVTCPPNKCINSHNNWVEEKRKECHFKLRKAWMIAFAGWLFIVLSPHFLSHYTHSISSNSSLFPLHFLIFFSLWMSGCFLNSLPFHSFLFNCFVSFTIFSV